MNQNWLLVKWRFFNNYDLGFHQFPSCRRSWHEQSWHDFYSPEFKRVFPAGASGE